MDSLNKIKTERKKMQEVKYDGRMFDNLVNLKKEIKELLVTINAVMNDMTLNKVNLNCLSFIFILK